jgi:phosphohistidine phosphatase
MAGTVKSSEARVKTLTLLRHAKSAWDDTVPRDFDRPLNGRGRRAAARIGQWIAEHDCAFDLVIASPAERVKQTLSEVATGARRTFSPVFEQRVYLASAATLVDVIREIDDKAAHVLLVGHNPGLEDLVLLLTPEGGGLRGEVEVKYPTAAVAVLELAVDHWADADEGGATLVEFIRPRDLDDSLGPED